MAVITSTNFASETGPVTIARTTLSASDTLVYVPGSGQVLFLYNPTAGALTATVQGSGATAISPPGYGGTISVAAGKAIVVPANTTVAVQLDDISAYLVGNITVNGAATLVAHLYS